MFAVCGFCLRLLCFWRFYATISVAAGIFKLSAHSTVSSGIA